MCWKLAISCLLVCNPAFTQIPAFPGAQGFGTTTIGGRGGVVLFVTNLNPSGPGSFRAALEATGPRQVVFQVGGKAVDHNILIIRNPFITIAGQTAPGGGFVYEGMVKVATHDVIMRGCHGWGWDTEDGEPAGNRGPIEIAGGQAYNVVVDRCTFYFGTDETAAVSGGAHDVTVSWSIAAYGLKCSIHPEGCHSKGLMVNNSGGLNHSLHHNLMAHNVDRNPNMIALNAFHECVGNVAYNGNFGGRIGNGAKANVEYNQWIAGPNTPNGRKGFTVQAGSPTGTLAYLSHNTSTYGRPTDTGDEWLVSDAATSYRSMTRLFTPKVTETRPLAEVKSAVLALAGALPRNALDRSVIGHVTSGGGAWIDRISEVTLPNVSGGTPKPDVDSDGLWDAWEMAWVGNLSMTANGDIDNDGYKNIEEYVNGIFASVRLIPAGPPQTEQ